jgi:xylulokinase
VPFLLAIDAGTTAVKAALFDPNGKMLAATSQEYTLASPAPDYVEMDPEAYWTLCGTAIRRVLQQARVPAHEVSALGISSQGETLLALDQNGIPLRPAIVWLDNRAHQEAGMLREEFGSSSIFETSGQPDALPTWPACKILWLRRREPSTFRRAKRYCLLEDYLIYRLTGRYVGEFSLFSSSLLLDVRRKIWWQGMLDFLEISAEMLPRLMESGQAIGTVSGEAAEDIGLTTATQVVTGALDQAAGMLGASNVKPGIVTETTGTALAVCTTVERPILGVEEQIPCHCHALHDKYYLLLCGQTAGIVLKWFRDQFCQAELKIAQAAGRDAYDVMTAEAKDLPPGADGLIMLPHLAGAACPEFDLSARGVFFGMTLHHTRAHFVRAIMESVAFMLRRNLDSLEHLGLQVEEIRSLGGGAKSPLWNQIKADVLQKPVLTMTCPEAALLGAAILAGVGIGLFGSVEQACEQMASVQRRVDPNPCQGQVYDRLYRLYIDLYGAVRPLFGRLQA